MQNLEAEEQKALFEWAAWAKRAYPELEWLHHVPNGGMRNKSTAVNLKKEGVKSGVPDIVLPVARGGYHGLYIELKAGGGKTSANQERWLEGLRGNGYMAVVCYGWTAARKTIEAYLKSKPVRQAEREV